MPEGENRMPEGNVPRRVVTGHDANGVSVVVSDGIVPVHRVMPEDGVGFYEVWQTSGAPAPITPDENDPTVGSIRVPPPVRGTKVRVNEFFPGFVGREGRQSPVHRTESVDYGIVLEGEIVLILDDSEVTLRAGDICVQRGTDHAWANRGESVCRVAFILIDGAFQQELLDVLPADVRGQLMTHGPHDGPAGDERDTAGVTAPLDHVGLSVGDLDAQAEWYGRVLDMRSSAPFEVPGPGLRGVFLSSDDGLVIELLERTGSTHRTPATNPQDELLAQGWGHICLRVPSVDDLFDRLVANGAGVVAPPGPAPEPGVRFAYLTDPEGNFIELLDRPWPVGAARKQDA